MRSTTYVLRNLMLAWFAATLFTSTAAGAIVVYDLRVDFSNSSNPNGTWKYLKGNTPLNHFTPVAQPGLAPAAANGYWGETSSSNNSAILLTTADGSTTGLWNDNDFLIGEVLVRTTDPASGASMIVAWTAPSNGSLTYSGGFWNANAPLGPGNNSFTLSLNAGPALESGAAFAPGHSNGYGMVNGLTPINVIAGDVLALEFNPVAGFPGSLSGVSFTIDFTPIPEPSSLLLLGAGLACCATIAWRRRAA